MTKRKDKVSGISGWMPKLIKQRAKILGAFAVETPSKIEKPIKVTRARPIIRGPRS